jgi:hypothetical protein
MTEARDRLKPRAPIPSVADNAHAVTIYELPHVSHERLLLVWCQ